MRHKPKLCTWSQSESAIFKSYLQIFSGGCKQVFDRMIYTYVSLRNEYTKWQLPLSSWPLCSLFRSGLLSPYKGISFCTFNWPTLSAEQVSFIPLVNTKSSYLFHCSGQFFVQDSKNLESTHRRGTPGSLNLVTNGFSAHLLRMSLV